MKLYMTLSLRDLLTELSPQLQCLTGHVSEALLGISVVSEGRAVAWLMPEGRYLTQGKVWRDLGKMKADVTSNFSYQPSSTRNRESRGEKWHEPE